MHYKRKRARTNQTRRSYDERRVKASHPTLCERLWLRRWPRWWDIVFHRRPERRKTRAAERKIVTGVVDVDAAIWPLGNNKPHSYYW
jgi:hypothetical protein